MFAVLAGSLRADSADDAWDVISALATDLSSGEAVRFLSSFDRAMAGYEELRNDVTALLAQAEVQSSIDLVSNEGDDRSRMVEVDWLLVIKRPAEVAAETRRQQHVKCKVEKQGKRWRIVSLAPAGFFAPAKG